MIGCEKFFLVIFDGDKVYRVEMFVKNGENLDCASLGFILQLFLLYYTPCSGLTLWSD